MNHLPAAREFLNAANKALAEVLVTGPYRSAISRAESNIDAAHGAIGRAMIETGWQPIETAPKDGTRIDLWGTTMPPEANGGYERYPNMHWHKRLGWVHPFKGVIGVRPQFWMPQPPAPSSSTPE